MTYITPYRQNTNLPNYTIDKLFDAFLCDWWPDKQNVNAIDMFETSSEVIVEAPQSGIPPENWNIELVDNCIRIEGKATKEEKEDTICHKRSYRSNEISVLQRLPCEIDPTQTKAKCENGILRIILKKLTNNNYTSKISVET